MSETAAPLDWSRGVPLMAGPYFLGLYQPSPETKDYWDGVAQREIRLKWCAHCQKAFHPKRIVCTDCGNETLGSKRASGRGTVYSFSEVHRAPAPVFKTPYTVGVVRLEEGVYLFGRIVADGGKIAVDGKVAADFRTLETGQTLPVFVTGAS